MVVGLGEKEKIEPDTLRRAAGAGIKHLLKLGSTEVASNWRHMPRHVAPAVKARFSPATNLKASPRTPAKKREGILTRPPGARSGTTS